METKISSTRREFIGRVATGAAVAAGLALMPQAIQAGVDQTKFPSTLGSIPKGDGDLDPIIKKIGKKAHPIAFDMSSINPWGLMWSNVYYITNKETGTTENELGLLCVLRHHGMIFALDDATIEKYNLGEFFGFNDPITKKSALRNPYYKPEEGVFPIPGLAGIKGLQDNGAEFFVCDMARKVYSQFVGQKHGVDSAIVYEDFVKGTLPGIHASPSGVWALGRLAENTIAYVDASVG